jgi:hydroxymethylpyrimidine/phosphomethylpyrimidine kinase
MEAVFEELPPQAVKTGMLFTAANLRVVADFFHALPARKRPALVVDPVLVSTSGTPLLARAARKVLAEELLPLATLATPNLDEMAALLGDKPETSDEMRDAAREFQRRYGCAVLVKGGHLKGRVAIDIFWDGKMEREFSARRVAQVRTHGTGCTYSAAICAGLALGHDLPAAVKLGKQFITEAIANSYRVGGHFALGQPAGGPGMR